MKRFLLLVGCLLVTTLFIPLQTFAEKEADQTTFEEVVVTATRDPEEIRKVPANATVITREEIERSSARTTVDLLRDEVGVVVRDLLGTGKSVSVDIRGFGETAAQNTLVLVDGRRVNEIDLSGVDWTQIPLDQVERIEIVRGAGSVLYGDNAVGGVVNIITKRPEKTFSAQVGVEAGSYGYNKEKASVGGKWGGLSAMLSASYDATHGYRDNGFLRAKDVGGKLVYDLSEVVSLDFSSNLHQDDAGLPGGLTKLDMIRFGRDATLRPDDQAETKDGYASLGIKAKLSDGWRLDAELSYRNRDVSDAFVSFNFSDRRNLRTWSFTPRSILESNLFGRANKLTLGLDLYRSDSRVDSEFVIPGFASYNRVEVTKKSVGLYALDEFSLLENLILSLGYRSEWASYDLLQEVPRAEDKTRDHEPAFQAGLDYLFAKKSSAFLSFKRSFRFPVSDELLQFFPTFQVNPTMKPQVGYHYEAGVRHAFHDAIEGNLTLFWADLRDEIFFNPETFSNENISKTRRRGVEAGLKVKPLSWITLWGNYAYIQPLLREHPFSGNDIPAVPRHKGSIGSDVDLGKGFLLNAKANLVGSRYLISDFRNRFDRLDPYCTLDLRLSYLWKGLRAFAGVNNLFNRKYSEYGVVGFMGNQSFYPSPERNFIVGASYSF